MKISKQTKTKGRRKENWKERRRKGRQWEEVKEGKTEGENK